MAFRFLHTADWQVGKPFGGFPGDAGAELRKQRIDTVERLARLASERDVDAVLVAGDAFDSNEVGDRTIGRLLDALKPYAGPWIFLPGNHDAALAHSVWTRLRQFQPGANIVIADRPEPVDLWGGRAVVLPAPLLRRRETEDQTAWFDAAETAPWAIRIGLAHGSMPSRLPAAAEASNPIAEDRAETARLDYLALGDWHGALKIGPRTWYAGTPETDRHRDNQSGQALLVEIEAPGAPERVKLVPTGAFVWRRLGVALEGGSCEAALEALAGLGPEPRRAIVSLSLGGAVTLAERHRLETELGSWRHRTHHLDVDMTGLLDEPSADDLDSLDTAGFVRVAVERLRAIAQDPANPQAAAARLAIRQLYLDHVGAPR